MSHSGGRSLGRGPASETANKQSNVVRLTAEIPIKPQEWRVMKRALQLAKLFEVLSVRNRLSDQDIERLYAVAITLTGNRAER